VMASGALPPGLPPLEIEGKQYWDGGLVSNTPLNYVLEVAGDRHDMCIFQVDLFNARGGMPRTILEVAQREKEIRYSSRTRLNTDEFRQKQTMRRAARRLIARLPPELRDDPDAQMLEYWSCDAAVTIAQLIYRRKIFETHSMDYEFSRRSVEEHWQAGLADIRHGLVRPEWTGRHKPDSGVAVFDLTRGEAAV
jgi:NTE family protein